MKKVKKIWTVGNDFPTNGNTESSRIQISPQFLSIPEKNCGIYWLDSYNLLASKNLSVYVSIKFTPI